jgi:hypothetical protein
MLRGIVRGAQHRVLSRTTLETAPDVKERAARPQPDGPDNTRLRMYREVSFSQVPDGQISTRQTCCVGAVAPQHTVNGMRQPCRAFVAFQGWAQHRCQPVISKKDSRRAAACRASCTHRVHGCRVLDVIRALS